MEASEPSRREDQRAEDARTRSTQHQADAMARERQRQELQAARQRPTLLAPPVAAAPPAARPEAPTGTTRPKLHKPKRRGQGADPQVFSAQDGTSPAKKKEKAPRKPRDS